MLRVVENVLESVRAYEADNVGHGHDVTFHT
jgi:hypothetical protein